jgi:protein-tyrosine phosphatase
MTERAPRVDDSAVKTPAPDLYLDWLELAAAPGFAGTRGRFGMTILPGRRCSGQTAKEPRDIERDAVALAALDVDTFVLLVEDHELVACGVPTFSTVLAEHGIPVIRCPIIDHRTPRDRSSAPRPLSRPPHSGHVVPAPGDIAAFEDLVRNIELRLSEGQTLAVSCHGGLGRTGMLAACLLKRAGLDAETAMTVVRRSRPGAIDHPSQETFIRGW